MLTSSTTTLTRARDGRRSSSTRMNLRRLPEGRQEKSSSLVGGRSSSSSSLLALLLLLLLFPAAWLGWFDEVATVGGRPRVPRLLWPCKIGGIAGPLVAAFGAEGKAWYPWKTCAGRMSVAVCPGAGWPSVAVGRCEAFVYSAVPIMYGYDDI